MMDVPEDLQKRLEDKPAVEDTNVIGDQFLVLMDWEQSPSKTHAGRATVEIIETCEQERLEFVRYDNGVMVFGQ